MSCFCILNLILHEIFWHSNPKEMYVSSLPPAWCVYVCKECVVLVLTSRSGQKSISQTTDYYYLLSLLWVKVRHKVSREVKVPIQNFIDWIHFRVIAVDSWQIRCLDVVFFISLYELMFHSKCRSIILCLQTNVNKVFTAFSCCTLYLYIKICQWRNVSSPTL